MSLAAQEQTQFSSLGRFFTEALADTDPDLFHSIDAILYLSNKARTQDEGLPGPGELEASRRK